jgi:hypothetical protein
VSQGGASAEKLEAFDRIISRYIIHSYVSEIQLSSAHIAAYSSGFDVFWLFIWGAPPRCRKVEMVPEFRDRTYEALPLFRDTHDTAARGAVRPRRYLERRWRNVHDISEAQRSQDY